MDINKNINYWLNLAELDIPVMEHLFQTGDYHYSLFIGHLVLEKTIKAHFVKHNQKVPPRIHDLVKLSISSGIDLDEEKTKLLLIINSFNLKARYPEEKLSFYKSCTQEFAKEYIHKIKEMHKNG